MRAGDTASGKADPNQARRPFFPFQRTDGRGSARRHSVKLQWLHLKLIALAAMMAACGAVAGEPAEYHLAAGDVVDVTVRPQHVFDHTVIVQPDGQISYPVAGKLQAAGLTLDQLTGKIRAGLKRELIDPEVSVSLKELNKQVIRRVSLLGAIRNPNVYEIKEDTTVAELLAAGGGPLSVADLQRVVVTHPDQTVIVLDLTQTEQTGRLVRNIVLQPGDMVIVPEGTPPTVTVLGEVVKPGSYPIQGEARLLDALSEAGGPTPKAEMRRVILRRLGASEPRTLDLQPLLRGEAANAELNVRLAPGDTITIGETDQRVYVLGRVAKPDIYAIKPNDRVLDALAEAGGAAADGDLSKVVLMRRGENGRQVVNQLDLKQMIKSASTAANDLLRPGDVLFVPDRKIHRSPLEALSLLFPLAGFVNLFR